MSKKLVFLLLLAALLAGGAFAQTSSLGIGGTFTADFIRLAWTKDYTDIAPAGFQKSMLNQNIAGGGFFAYVDITYVILSLGMGFYDISPVNSDAKKQMDDDKKKISLTTVDISLFGKYPIPLGGALLFPLLGVDFKIAVSADDIYEGERFFNTFFAPGGAVSEYWSSVWIKFGVGGDLPLGDKFYIRPMILYGFGTVPKFFRETVASMASSASLAIRAADVIFHGLDVKVAVGYKF